MTPIQRFKYMDLAFLTVIAVFAEAVGVGALSRMFDQNSPLALQLSLAIPLLAIAMVRWNFWALPMAVLVGITTYIASGGGAIQYLVTYALGNLGIVLGMVWFKIADKDEMKNEWVVIILYYLTAYIGVILLRSVVTTAFGLGFWSSFQEFFWLGEMLNMVIGSGVVIIASRQKTTMLDMNTYLLNLQKRDVIDDE